MLAGKLDRLGLDATSFSIVGNTGEAERSGQVGSSRCIISPTGWHCAAGTPRWVKLSGAAAAGLVVLIGIAILASWPSELVIYL